jgi:hypothetical protein
MANQIQTQVILDGPRNAIVKVTGILDTSDVPLTNIISVANFCNAPKGFRIEHVDYSITDQLELQVLWQGSPDVVILPVAGRGKMSFGSFGGLINNAGSSATGGIDIKTTGWSSGTQIFTLILELVKVGGV